VNSHAFGFQGDDFIPGTEEMVLVLKACRKLNDYALAIRFMEAVKVSTFC